jgi:hypothetical protein
MYSRLTSTDDNPKPDRTFRDSIRGSRETDKTSVNVVFRERDDRERHYERDSVQSAKHTTFYVVLTDHARTYSVFDNSQGRLRSRKLG